MEWMWS